ncbi:MAG: bifunctional 5,10-methylene-tetrahydrofolate dehydrogenase/5,10-methylene-tetrahydrofolate cyclohydrolase [SAR86 cluster bacterium BACL1 MAG-121105-bin34]|jgi:methylenetetrahydrofolate dehydrogenase (NADP+) / methenyltetrahydrofolate cyclohydrolase|uniref:Bifunctional protein FolD n=2 Tax=SAR86 cluster TaxID=62672 RepID=A0A0R2U5Z3_9GAMM|nr:MAG: bifunctional 5,10-methylene-tetrahydrofolate dehydrogenase/5,10-methylene-tetrahydrofolate cyclohydrolase [SAR86 cluster bacterium BACL1 MAG-120507-bin14]KRO40849.1 MAG: bifunctional 5,10-methylene-tetrahydrofolate dehydrogenase/5,10-methylene-tetrahydrofolate cyclohydrolase [SAR86 cluster bacterium BACL1 MAG-120920-bin57]KRO94969.1 MAG: bifunctional 5,10-methylene-tetrahydrofolate dehydrogenase/5,10-methylene-tetrahydrofolate cyclohydrolase [SAR86 cluster bacterium BACL1 MAG-120820-bin45
MSSKILDGKGLALIAEEEIQRQVSELKNEGIVPTLATVLVGVDPASATYVKMKQNACARLGMESIAIELGKETTTAELLATIHELNNDPKVHGILLQHPVPSHINERECFDAISVAKDVDGVTCLGFGQMTMGEPAYGSCTPAGIMRMLDYYEIDISGKHAVVVGRSPILGKPMAMMLLNKNATVTVCHSRTEHLELHIKNADILVGAVGVPRLIKKEWIKDGAVVIDAGYHPAEKCGDIELDGIENLASAHTPVPGGVGPMTINTLILNTLLAAQKLVPSG